MLFVHPTTVQVEPQGAIAYLSAALLLVSNQFHPFVPRREYPLCASFIKRYAKPELRYRQQEVSSVMATPIKTRRKVVDIFPN